MVVEDPYLWLEDLGNKRVVEWALRQSRESVESLRPLSDRLYERVLHFYKLPYLMQSVITDRGYMVLLREGGSFRVAVLRRDGSREPLIDSKDLGKDIVLRGIYAPRDGDLLGLSFSEAGADEGILRILDVDSGEVLDELKGVVGDLVWLDGGRYYYVKSYRREKTPDGVEPPTSRVFLREDGKEEMIFGEGVPTSHFITLRRSTSGLRALLEVNYGWTRNTVYGGDLKDPASWRRVYGGDGFVAHPIDFVEGGYLIASYEGGGFGKLLHVTDGGVREVVGEGKYPLQGAALVDSKIVATYLVDASSTIKIYDLSGLPHGERDLLPQGTISLLDSDGHEVLLKYESFTVPYRFFSLRGDLELREVDKAEAGLGEVSIEDRWTRSKDGTPIHYFLVRKRGAEASRALVYGYGGFRISITPRFNPLFATLIEGGAALAVANLRGGCEFGEEWHRAGMRERKQNVFDDFAAVLRDLKEAGARVVAFGRSNGGLLVSTVMTQHPELLDGAVIGYPVIDMLRFHRLYVGKAWVPEYGDPDDPGDREFLLRYSPYHHVRAGVEYPPTLVYTGLHDDRVHPAHAFKFVARLRDVGARPLLRVETSSGHAGASPEIKAREEADILSFVYRVLGVEA
ncbi:S9 family peptidase [Candidatus Bathyarchaeota archaeon]|nr:MAG: S9 family peptidase [Candidatus Bathyarchaeota archaeon]